MNGYDSIRPILLDQITVLILGEKHRARKIENGHLVWPVAIDEQNAVGTAALTQGCGCLLWCNPMTDECLDSAQSKEISELEGDGVALATGAMGKKVITL
ncbi:hypothetical protein ASF08_23420 [Methylobacterium sp. Leaf85]|nr:hypothetical protein ASF08_23420 [Methylobacterium sp. Leaf85]